MSVRVLILFFLGAAVACASSLLFFPEPGEGLLGDPGEFARLAPPREIAAGPHGFARHLNAVQRHHLALEGKHPPIYYFFCTVYYIPRETGFKEESGFDTTPDRRLGGKTFGRAFARAVRMEGSGRLEKPGPKGRKYIDYLGNYRRDSLGNRNNVLTDRKSAAVHLRNPLFKHGTPLRVLDPQIFNTFGSTDFETADTGGGLFKSQIDLYWGEDDPMDPIQIARPASCDVAVRWIVPVIVGGGR
jgi:hypothetical protein